MKKLIETKRIPTLIRARAKFKFVEPKINHGALSVSTGIIHDTMHKIRRIIETEWQGDPPASFLLDWDWTDDFSCIQIHVECREEAVVAIAQNAINYVLNESTYYEAV